MKPLGIALLGCGVVGSGVVRLLTEQSERMERRAGRALQLRHVVVRETEKERLVTVPKSLISDDPYVKVVAWDEGRPPSVDRICSSNT